ncbi:ATP-binding protein [cf. Phormidesmis sp. LEGE 11477]|uniref:sensor histidine kinase n=1 Tax=cf. Phormidesmis sp. LEGE 11477 TaxID=1828680 RepID=UPI001880B5EC|nr:ATP-binding protein [cf. Phormidesmis sp. LEGE 11477]MBE9063711.1 PAS domain-containing protein [cf. Phormidesmis sp. LEGE 11477]
MVNGYPALATAIGFVLIGANLLLLIKKRHRTAQGLSGVIFAGALLVLIEHLYATVLYQAQVVTGKSLYTAIVLLLSLGILFVQSDRGWMSELSGERIGSVMLRRSLPWTIVLPNFLGVLVLWIYQHLSLPFESALALSSVLGTVVFSSIIVWNGRRLNQLDSRLDDYHQSEQQRADASLQQNQAVLQRRLAEIESIYQTAPIGLSMLDPDLRFVRINQRLADMNGFSIEDHIGQKIADLLPNLADTAEQLLRPILATGEPLLNVEIRGETPAQPGIERIWLEHFLPLKEGDRTIGISTVCEEVTERKRVERSLYDRAQQQAAVARIGRQAIAIDQIDPLLKSVADQVTQVLKAECCEVLELLPGSGQGLKLRSATGWPDRTEQVVFSSDRTYWMGYTLSTSESTVVTNLSSETRFISPLLSEQQVVSGMSTVIGNSNDCPFGVLAVHTHTQRDFSEDDVNFLQAIANIIFEAITRHQTEQRIRQANAELERRIEERTHQLVELNRELESFAYSVAHDLRTPLRAIEGFAGILREDYSSSLDETGQQYTQILIDSAARLDRLIQDLLDYSRLGRSDIRLVSVNLFRIVESVLHELTPTYSAPQPQVEVIEKPHFGQAQRSILKQVINNLLTNAIKFVPAERPPVIRIWSEERIEELGEKKWIRLWIEDNGIGIAPQYRDRIFLPFERLQGIEQYPGTGIGLAIVQRGIERMGGQVGIEPAPSGGSRFWIELRQP